MSVSRKSLFTFLWAVIGSFLALFTQLYAAKVLGAEEFGKANIIIGLALAFSYILHLGLPLSFVKNSASLKNKHQLLSRYLATYLVLDVPLLVAIAVASFYLLKNAGIDDGFSHILCVLLAAFSQLALLYYRYLESDGKASVASFVKNTSSRLMLLATFLFYIIFYEGSYLALVTANILMFGFPLLFLLARIEFPSFSPDWSLLKPAIPYYISSVCYNFYYGASRYVAGYFQEDAIVAFLSIAISASSVFLLLNSAITSVAMPEVARHWSESVNKVEEIGAIYRKFARLLAYSLTAPILFLCFNLKVLLGLLGSEYAEGAIHVIIMIVASYLVSLSSIAHVILNMTSYKRTEMRIGIVTLVLGLGLGCALGSASSVGVTISLAVSISLAAFVRVYKVKKILGLLPYDGYTVWRVSLYSLIAIVLFLISRSFFSGFFVLWLDAVVCLVVAVCFFIFCPHAGDDEWTNVLRFNR